MIQTAKVTPSCGDVEYIVVWAAIQPCCCEQKPMPDGSTATISCPPCLARALQHERIEQDISLHTMIAQVEGYRE